MTDSNREMILDAYKATLQNITIAKGFNNTVSRVVRKMLSWDDPTVSFPILMLLGGNETFEDEFGEKAHSQFSIKIRGYTKDMDEPEEELNSLIKDVLKVLENKTYNTYHSSFRPISVDTDEGWLNSESEGVAMFEITILQRYRFDRSDP